MSCCAGCEDRLLIKTREQFGHFPSWLIRAWQHLFLKAFWSILHLMQTSFTSQICSSLTEVIKEKMFFRLLHQGRHYCYLLRVCGCLAITLCLQGLSGLFLHYLYTSLLSKRTVFIFIKEAFLYYSNGTFKIPFFLWVYVFLCIMWLRNCSSRSDENRRNQYCNRLCDVCVFWFLIFFKVVWCLWQIVAILKNITGKILMLLIFTKQYK